MHLTELTYVVWSSERLCIHGFMALYKFIIIIIIIIIVINEGQVPALGGSLPVDITAYKLPPLKRFRVPQLATVIAMRRLTETRDFMNSFLAFFVAYLVLCSPTWFSNLHVSWSSLVQNTAAAIPLLPFIQIWICAKVLILILLPMY